MQTSAAASAAPLSPSRELSPVAGVIAGLAAALAYLLAQMLFAATVQGGEFWAPLQRISAILLGPNAVDPHEALNIQVAGMALLIHFALGAVYGRVIDFAVRGRESITAIAVGAGVGLAIYVVNYWVLTPIAFAWFGQNRGATTLIDHLMFGVVAAAVYVPLRRQFARQAA